MHGSKQLFVLPARAIKAMVILKTTDKPLYNRLFGFADLDICHGLDKLWKWNVVCFGVNMYE
jgi:hypothetical protein